MKGPVTPAESVKIVQGWPTRLLHQPGYAGDANACARCDGYLSVKARAHAHVLTLDYLYRTYAAVAFGDMAARRRYISFCHLPFKP
jgi:hypothetical protein